MLEKPDLQDENIISCLQSEYELCADQVNFLPLGADPNTAVYHIIAKNETSYFLKLRSGRFDETSVTLPKFLSEQGIPQIIPPLATQTGQLWANLDRFKTILYPFVAGKNGYEVRLTDRHWRDFGMALKRIHTAVLPSPLTSHIQQETYSPKWRESVQMFLQRVETDRFADPIAAELAAFLKSKRDEILYLLGRAEQLAQTLQAQPPEFIVCHSDLHAGNFLIEANDTFYIVDWDNPIRAAKERDLMFVGGAQFGNGRTAQEEAALFYQGYGRTEINSTALAYYRYERIIEDIAVYCEQLFLTDEGGEDREQALYYLQSNFRLNGTIAMAYEAEK